jgi:hypothetical protein
MSEITQAGYDALVAQRDQLRAFLDQANLHVNSLAAEKVSFVASNRRLCKALEDVSGLIRAQKVEEALALIALVRGQEYASG